MPSLPSSNYTLTIAVKKSRKTRYYKIDITSLVQKKNKLFGVRTKLPYYKVFHRTSVSNRNEKPEILMNKPFYLGLSILDLSRILM